MPISRIKLPRGYLSHSQIDCVLRSEQEYVRKYIYGDEREASIQQEYGTIVTDILEGRKKCPKSLLKKLEGVPRYAKNDVDISCILSSGKRSFVLMGKLDGQTINPMGGYEQGEYKTGMVPWSSIQVLQSKQLRIYALIHYKNTGKIPHQQLTWLQTTWDGADIELTGYHRTWDVRFTTKDMLEIEAVCWNAYNKVLGLVETEMDKIV